METYYIVDANEPMPYRVLNSAHYQADGILYADYCTQPTSAQEYIAQEHAEKECEILSSSELQERCNAWKAKVSEEFTRITKKDFWNYLGCVPPARSWKTYAGWAFAVGEPYVADMHHWCIEIPQKQNGNESATYLMVLSSVQANPDDIIHNAINYLSKK